MRQILNKVNEIAEVLNDTDYAPNMNWMKNNVNELQKMIKERHDSPTTEQIDDVINDLNEYAMDCDPHEFGLPSYSYHIPDMRNIIRTLFTLS